MADITKLKRSITASKAWLSRAVAALTKSLELLESDHNHIQVEMDYNDVSKFELKLRENSEELCIQMEEHEIEEHIDSLQDILNRSKIVKQKYLKLVTKDKKSENGSVSLKKKVKLPKLDLKKFSGINPIEWIEFSEGFRLAVGEDEELDDSSKLQYLKRLVEGEAAVLITGLPLIASNFKVAWEILEKRFGNEKYLKELLVRRIRDVPACRSETIDNMKFLIDEVAMCVGQLQGFGVDFSKEYGTSVLPDLRDKLPHSWRLEWARYVERNKENCDFSEFMKFLYEELRIRIESSSFSNFTSDHQDYPLTSSTLIGEVQKLSVKSKPFCTFCGNAHYPRQCKKEMPVSERQKLVNTKNGCVKCGMTNHLQDRCFWKVTCQKCQKPHITQLCTKLDPSNYSTLEKESRKEEKQPVFDLHSGVGFSSSSIHLKTCRVVVNGSYVTRALIDSGCSRSFIRRDLAEAVNAEVIQQVSMNIRSFRDQSVSGVFDVVKIVLKGANTDAQLGIEAIVDDNPAGGQFDQAPTEVYSKIESLGFTPIADPSDGRLSGVGIILGEDVIDHILKGTAVFLHDEFKTTPSIFGWIVHGGSLTKRCSTDDTQVNMNRISCSDLERFWNLEHLGIVDHDRESGKEDLLKDIELIDNHYHVNWPFKEGLIPGVNKNQAQMRLKRLVSKMKPEEKIVYSKTLLELESDGYIEKTPVVPDGHCSYLPHRAVYKPESSTTKLRIVFDASAKEKNHYSLNDCLKPGPSLLPLIFKILLRFRRGPFAITGDIAKAFLQIRLKPESRDVTRFLWEEQEYRSTSVLFGATSSPAILQAVLDFHFQSLIDSEDFELTVLQALKGNVYMDDIVDSFFKKTLMETFWFTSVDLLKIASMELRKRRSSLDSFSDKDLIGKKLLGISWNEKEDVFIIQLPEFDSIGNKRELASLLGKIYDPLGLITPFLTPLKVLLQNLWMRKLDWTQSFPEDIKQFAEKAAVHLRQCEGMKIPRWIGMVEEGTCHSLHVFVDSSQRIYAATIYIKCHDGGCSLVASKSKLIPPKMAEEKFSPRFELLGCVLGAKLAHSVVESLDLKNFDLIFWTDSKVCLSWIKGIPHRWEVFVRNRVNQIHECSSGEWRYVSTSNNPADIPTRCDQIELDFWFHGPDWLKNESDDWPMELIELNNIEVSLLSCSEYREVSVNKMVLLELIRPSVSRWQVLMGALKRILRWRKLEIEITDAVLMAIIWRNVQKFWFSGEIRALKNGESFPRSSKLSSLSVFFDQNDELIRFGGRLQNAPLTFQEKHPIILLREKVVDLYVLFIHQKLCHAGPSVTVTELRRLGVHLLKGKRAVTSIIQTCRICRRFQAGPYIVPEAPLPVERVEFDRPFGVTGVDLLGPLYLENGYKVWVALFTCFQTRAVHLELVCDLSEAGFSRSFDRFVSRRSVPDIMWSDHGSNFVAFSKSLKNERFEMKWKFIVERAPWWGGLWERLVQSVKYLLRRVLGKRRGLLWEELETIVYKVEFVLNKRPISFIWQSESPVPVRPIDFLLYRGTKLKSLNLEEKSEWEIQLREVWLEKYLYSVLGSLKGRPEKNNQRCPQIGDVVLIHTEDKRQCWPIGVIKLLHRGGDGVVRSAKVKVGKKMLSRPVQKLFPLEMKLNEEIDMKL